MASSDETLRESSDANQRERWRQAPRERPSEIVAPGPGQESVWDYPRPPRLERVEARVRVEWAGTTVADTLRALRVCETSSPPAYYVPVDDLERSLLVMSEHTTLCEWKGRARYWSLHQGDAHSHDAAWSYPVPDPRYAGLREHFAFHAGRVDACYVGEVRVQPQPGEFYGGWITPELVGPFKGEAGSEGW